VYPKLFFSYQVLLDASKKHKHSTFEEISKILKNFDFFGLFSIFEAQARPPALKILKSRRTKVVPYECPHFFRLQLFLIFAYFDFVSIFEFEIFPYKNSSLMCMCQVKEKKTQFSSVLFNKFQRRTNLTAFFVNLGLRNKTAYSKF
jgi:hypothetical protein